MRQKVILQILLVLVGLFFVAGIYPLLTSIPQHNQSDYGDQMMLAVYFVLGVFLLLAVRRPEDHRSLIAFTGWGTLAHDAVMAVQAAQLKQLQSELLPLIIVAILCVALIALVPPKQRDTVSESGLRESPIGIERS
jgi:peptidoglycan/LPS O-acetylase OafA/YrhL